MRSTLVLPQAAVPSEYQYIHDFATSVTLVVKDIYSQYLNGTLRDGTEVKVVDVSNSSVSGPKSVLITSFGNFIAFPPDDKSSYSTYLEKYNISYRSKTLLRPPRTPSDYVSTLHLDAITIPDLSVFTEEYFFQMSTLGVDWSLQLQYFFSFLNANDVPLFYTTYNAFVALGHNLCSS